MSSTAQWYRASEEAGLEELQRSQEERRAASVASYRFFLKPGENAKLIVLDEKFGFFIYEHNLKLNGRWGNFYTCRHDFSECPICESGDKPGYVAMMTVIDTRPYTTKDGRTIRGSKRLLACKQAVINKLARRREENDGSLQYCVVQFARDSEKECATGEDIQVSKRLTAAEVLKFRAAGSDMSDEDWLKPFDYIKLFEPKSIDEMRRVVGQAPPIGADDYRGNGTDKASVPRDAEFAPEDSLEALL